MAVVVTSGSLVADMRRGRGDGRDGVYDLDVLDKGLDSVV